MSYLRAQEAYCGKKLWEEKHAEVASALWALAFKRGSAEYIKDGGWLGNSEFRIAKR